MSKSKNKAKEKAAPAASKSAAKVQLVKKISAKVLIGTKQQIRAAAEAGKGDSVVLFKAYGIASGKRTGGKDMGDGTVSNWTALVGNMGATRIDDGKEFRSNQMFLPEPMQGMIVSALDGGAKDIQFSCEVGVVADESAAVGYVYFCNPIGDVAQNDALETVRLKALGHDG